MPPLAEFRTWPGRLARPLAFALAAIFAGLTCGEPSDERRLDIEIREPQPRTTEGQPDSRSRSGSETPGERSPPADATASKGARADARESVGVEEDAAAPPATLGEAASTDASRNQ